jgi:hypothetical protein
MFCSTWNQQRAGNPVELADQALLNKTVGIPDRSSPRDHPAMDYSARLLLYKIDFLADTPDSSVSKISLIQH